MTTIDNMAGYIAEMTQRPLESMTICYHRRAISTNPYHHNMNEELPAWQFLDWKLEGPKVSPRCIRCRISHQMQCQSTASSDAAHNDGEVYGEVHQRVIRNNLLGKLDLWKRGLLETHGIEAVDPFWDTSRCQKHRPLHDEVDLTFKSGRIHQLRTFASATSRETCSRLCRLHRA